MNRKGYEVDELATRKVMWSPMTGLFTRKQKHTIVFTKTGSGIGEPTSEEANAFSVLLPVGLEDREIYRMCKARNVSVVELMELYWAGQVPELGVPGRVADEALPSTSTPTEPEPTQAAGSVGSVADELAKLAALRDSGVLSGDEFAAQKAKLLAG